MDLSELLKELEKEEENNSKSNSGNIKLILLKYLKSWKLFAISIFACFSLAVIVAYFSTPQYLIKASLVLKDQKKGSDFSSNLDEFMGYKTSYVVENEVEVFKSESLMIKVCEELNYTNAYYTQNGLLRWKEIYDWEVPIKVTIHDRSTGYYPDIKDNSILINLIDEQSFELQMPDSIKKIGKFGEKFENYFGTFSVAKNTSYPKFLDYDSKPLKVTFLDPTSVGKYFANNLSVDIVNKQASVIEMYLYAGHPKIGEAILTKLLELYNEDAENEKNLIATNTIAFIDDQLKDLTQELASVEKEAEKFKLNYSITDVNAESQLYLQSTTTNRQQISQLSVQIDVLESIENYINRDVNDIQMVPSTLIIEDATLINLIADFNQIQRERERMLRTTQPNNPIVINLNQQLIGLKTSILENIKNIKNGLVISRNSLLQTADQFQSRASKVPTIERELLDINRTQAIKQEQYILLTQKKEEALLTLAATAVGNSKIIQPPMAYDKPAKPKKIIYYAFGLIMGLGVPFAFIFVNDIIKEKIEFRSDIEAITSLKILGEISKNKNNTGILAITKGKKSLLAEQFRYIRSNLIPFAQKSGSKVIMVSSGMSGEGKTFFSLNLATSLGITGKTVALLEMDLRKPALLSELNIKSDKGIVELLKARSINYKPFIKKHKSVENVDIIGCGSIPEDPAELLADSNLDGLIGRLKEDYDYVIIDTAPVGLVSDSFLLSEVADLSIFIVRCDYSTKNQVRTLEDIRKNKRFKNPMIVINDAQMNVTYGYGPKYASGYYNS